MNNLSWRTVSSAVVLVAAIVLVIPSFKPSFWPYRTINLGLDLQGGMHLVLEVESDKTVDDTLERMSHEIRTALRKEKIRTLSIDKTKKQEIVIELNPGDDANACAQLIKEEFPLLEEKKTSTADGVSRSVYAITESEINHIKKMAVAQALETIRNRIDQFGVSEPDIRRQGENRILLQLAGIDDPQRAKELIGKTALLEFKLVDENHSVESALKGDVPPGSEILYQMNVDPSTGRTTKKPYLIKKRTALTGAYLTQARVQFSSQFNEPYVAIEFDRKGARIFERITEEATDEPNEQQRLAIVLDNKVYSAPVIKTKISGGKAIIEGNFTHNEASDLAIVLRAGALPAPVKILEERTVGPSLGADSIHKGFFSMLIGGILVVIFMAIYYKGAGLIADIALILNILLIAAGLAVFQATLTLPGIAGIILTIGMAVDANVLIFERIREELDLGKTPMAAVDTGYERATLTILDANVTTLIAAVVLFQFGTGAVQGFAVTLSLGVIASLFTALIFTREIFEYFLGNRKIRTLSI